jgi:hypothetical protein
VRWQQGSEMAQAEGLIPQQTDTVASQAAASRWTG